MLFFCNSITETLTAIKKDPSNAFLTVYLNKFHRLVNAIDTNISQYRGWISINGLPFDSWCKNSFEALANLCGGLFELDWKNSSFSCLTEAFIRVKANVASILHIIHLKYGHLHSHPTNPFVYSEYTFQSDDGSLLGIPIQKSKGNQRPLIGQVANPRNPIHLEFRLQKRRKSPRRVLQLPFTTNTLRKGSLYRITQGILKNQFNAHKPWIGYEIKKKKKKSFDKKRILSANSNIYTWKRKPRHHYKRDGDYLPSDDSTIKFNYYDSAPIQTPDHARFSVYQPSPPSPSPQKG